MGQGFSNDSGSVVPRDRASVERTCDIFSVIGADWTAVLPPFRRIIDAAQERGYRAVLLTQDGVVGIYLDNSLQLRVQLGSERLVPGQWEESVAKLFAQVGLLNEVIPDADQEICSAQLSKALLAIFGLPSSAKLHCAVHSFPGATQCLVSLNEQLVASIVFNPVHKFLLEFRLDPMPLILAYDQDHEVIHASPHPLGEGISDAAPGILRLARSEQRRALVIIDGVDTFGSQLRRTMLRVLPHLADLGYRRLFLDFPEVENEVFQSALAGSSPLEYYLGRASTTPADISPEWTAILSLAHSLSMTVGGGGHELDNESLLDAITSGDEQQRVIVWLPYRRALLASQWMEKMHGLLGEHAGLCIAPMRASQLDPHFAFDPQEVQKPILVPLRLLLERAKDQSSLAALFCSSISDDTQLFVSKDTPQFRSSTPQ